MGGVSLSPPPSCGLLRHPLTHLLALQGRRTAAPAVEGCAEAMMSPPLTGAAATLGELPDATAKTEPSASRTATVRNA